MGLVETIQKWWRSYERFLRVNMLGDRADRLRARVVYTFGWALAFIQFANFISLRMIYGEFRTANFVALSIAIISVLIIQSIRYVRRFTPLIILYLGIISAAVILTAHASGNGINNALIVFCIIMPIVAGMAAGPRLSIAAGFVVIGMTIGLYLMSDNAYRFVGNADKLAAEHRLAQTIFATVLITSISAVFSATMFSAFRRLEVSLNSAWRAEAQKGEFLARMSHELRTPLNGVVGLSSALTKTKLSDGQAELVTPLAESAEHLLDIVNDVLDYSSLRDGKLTLKPERFNLKGLIKGVGRTFQTELDEKNLDFTITYPSHLSDFFIGDEVRIKQIVSNLVSNAIKFTDEGEIEVCIKRENDDPTAPLLICVSDTGPGIDVALRESIFERYYQIDSDKPEVQAGTGLGLAISRELARLMEGDVTVIDPHKMKGAKFQIRVPLNAAPTFPDELGANHTPPSVSAGSDDEPLAGLNIIVIDDHPRNLLVSQVLLEALGASCTIAPSGKSGLIKLSENTYDAVILDKRMPDMNGFEVLEAIRSDSALKDLKVFACTADILSEEREELLALGFDGFLAKPLTPTLLARELRTVLKA